MYDDGRYADGAKSTEGRLCEVRSVKPDTMDLEASATVNGAASGTEEGDVRRKIERERRRIPRILLRVQSHFKRNDGCSNGSWSVAKHLLITNHSGGDSPCNTKQASRACRNAQIRRHDVDV